MKLYSYEDMYEEIMQSSLRNKKFLRFITKIDKIIDDEGPIRGKFFIPILGPVLSVHDITLLMQYTYYSYRTKMWILFPWVYFLTRKF